jgi:V8-like Glu-specific endopeptidase
MKAKKAWPSAVLVSTLLLMVLVLQAAAVSSDTANGGLSEGVTIAGQGQLYTLPQLHTASMPADLNDFGSSGNREPQLVIGPDSRIQITDTTVDPFRKIVDIWAGNPDTGESSGCTGTFIGARVILTAAHCIWDTDFNGWPELVVVTPGLNIDHEPFGSAEATNLWVPQEWIDTQGDIFTASEWDYGLIVLNDDALGNTVGTMVIGVLDDDALNAPDFNPMTAGYPGDKPDGTMWFGSEPAFTAVTAVGLEHAIDSFQGQSGSAVWRAADQLIVGIESYETAEINIARRITQDVIDDYIAVCQQLGCTFNVAIDGDPPPPTEVDPAFQRTWERTDRPVADGQATRTWTWGPQPSTQVLIESYDEAPNGQRQVQYYDKSRMEITNPAADSTSIWYVTNGLLATELITGQMQVGNSRFVDRNPASVNVAGDANDPNGPTYATFTPLMDAAPSPVGTTLIQRVNRAGMAIDDPTVGNQGITIGFVDQITNHGIATPFWEFMNSSGTIYENGAFTNAKLFENAFFATGRPITEPYWADVLVGGTTKLVLIQCFERRCLTFTPDNPPEWRVEMGNIGQHYFTWRYQN